MVRIKSSKKIIIWTVPRLKLQLNNINKNSFTESTVKIWIFLECNSLYRLKVNYTTKIVATNYTMSISAIKYPVITQITYLVR